MLEGLNCLLELISLYHLVGALWGCRKALALQQVTYKTLKTIRRRKGGQRQFIQIFPYKNSALETCSCKRQGKLNGEEVSTQVFMNEGKKNEVELQCYL